MFEEDLEELNFTEEEIEEGEKEERELEKEEIDSSVARSAFAQYMNDIKDYKPLNNEELMKLFEDMHNGDATAREKIILANLSIPIKLATKYSHMNDFEDIVSEGNVWLIKAVDNYDTSKGYKFSSYAYVVVKRGIARYFINRIGMHLPSGSSAYQMVLITLQTAYENYVNENSKQPSFEELQEITGFTKDMVMSLFPIISGALSLNEGGFRVDGDTVSTTLGDTIEQTIYPTPEDSIEELDLKEKIALAVKKLEKEEQIAIISTYGLDGNKPLTFTDLSNLYGKTRQRWQQIQVKGLNKLKVIATKMGLQMYL